MTEADPAFDPFEAHLDFAARAVSGPMVTAGDRPELGVGEVIDTRADQLLDMDALEEMAAFHGIIRPPRIKAEGELDDEVTEAMTEREPQFVLRNLPRVERLADPDDPLEYAKSRIPYGLDAEGAIPERPRLDPPELLETMHLDLIRDHRGRMRWLYDEARWNRYFGREIKANIRGPLWRYDPDAPVDDDPQAE